MQLDSMNLWNYCHENLSYTRISMDKVILGIFHLMKNYQKHFMHHYSTKNFDETLKNAAKPLFLHSPRFAQYSYLSTQITGLSSGSRVAHSSSTETRQCSTYVKKCFQCKTRLLKELLKICNTLQVKEVKIVVLISLQGSLIFVH